CNSLFTGLSKQGLRQLQLIQNPAARVLTKTRKYDHITPVLVPYEPSRSFRTSGAGPLADPRVRTKHAEAAFCYHATQTWKNLPEDIRQAPTLTIFKSKLKIFLFYTAYSTS
ncbi:hypothetical protein LDENG_00072590, partial [Lucifuga dentata]